MSEIKILLVDVSDPDSLWEVSVALLSKALKDPEKRAAMDTACNDPKVDRKQLLSIGFSFGVCETVNMFAAGHCIEVPKQESNS